MVVCIVALIVFAFMGIFSAKYRTYAKEASRCVFRMVTLRPCDTNFDQKMKSKITAKLMKKNPKFAGFVYKNFNILSWIFVIIFIMSFVLIVNGIYNLYIYGTCDPYTGNCIFNQQKECNILECSNENCTCAENCTEINSINCGCSTNIIK
ncbi:MAG: hypothetical protein QXD48_03550 [Candidatus Aenigmatarchaeota archaeon]